MKNNIWQSYQPGQASSVLPPGYMEAATAPGRAIGQGIQSGLQSLAAGIQQRGMMQREDAKDAQKQAREAEKEAKDRAKEFDRIFEQGKYMGVWGEDAKTRSVEELAGQLQGAFQKEQMDAAKLATRMKVMEHETAQADRDERQRGIAAYMESQGMPLGVQNPNAGYAIAGNFPAAAVHIAKMMPDPQKQPEFYSDPQTGARFMTRGNTTMPSNPPAPEKPAAQLQDLIPFKDPGTGAVQPDVYWNTREGKLVDLRQSENPFKEMIRMQMAKQPGLNLGPTGPAPAQVRRKFDMGDYAVEELKLP